jgi:hypothetical protein
VQREAESYFTALNRYYNVHSCVANLAGMEVKVKLDNCRKRAGEGVSVHVHTIFSEELSDIHAKGHEMVTEIPK